MYFSALIKLNNNVSKSELNKTIKLISEDRDEFFESISPPAEGLLIALHNNIREYSIDNEIPLSTEVSLKNKNHPDHHNFFICTNREDYNLLKVRYRIQLFQSFYNLYRWQD